MFKARSAGGVKPLGNLQGLYDARFRCIPMLTSHVDIGHPGERGPFPLEVPHLLK